MVYERENNYCTLSPDELYRVRFNHACYLHDRQYRNEVKVRKTRKQADIDFREHMFKIFKNHGKTVRGYIISWIYYIGVRVLSKRFWV